MKPIFLALFFIIACFSSNAQLKAKVLCDPFDVDILNGKVNGFKPNTGIEQLKAAFPCFTNSESETNTSKCGGTVVFADKGLIFFTTKDYIEIKTGFKGKMSIQLLGAKRGSFFKTFGNPKIKDESWDAYQMSYGTLVLHYDKTNKINLVQFSTNGTETLSLCD